MLAFATPKALLELCRVFNWDKIKTIDASMYFGFQGWFGM
jgi:hypothetical protein